MNKILSLFLLCFCVTFAWAQNLPEISVVSFTEKPFDTSARDDRYKIVDGNGELFSIIKLVSATPDDDLRAYSFDFGLCESRVKDADGEVWIYVQRNAMRATIKRTGYKAVKNYELNTTVQPGKVYEMVLSAEALKVQKQMVLFKISPVSSNATVMYKSNKPGSVEQVLGIIDSNGEVQENLPLGTYSYRVISKNYHPSEGLLILNDVNKTYVDNITLSPNFSVITLTAEEGVEIFVDGKSVGVGRWSGNMNAGSYNVECRRESYKPGHEVIKVTDGVNSSIRLKPLEPICGSLSIKSLSGARITIDGKDYGTAPKNINDILVGSHTIVVTNDGYQRMIRTVVVREGEQTEETFQLERAPQTASLYVSTQQTVASVDVDGEYAGETPLTIQDLTIGTHKVKISAPGFKSKTMTAKLNGGDLEEWCVELEKKRRISTNWYDERAVYAELTGGALNFWELGADVGLMLPFESKDDMSFNLETFFAYGMEKETLYSYNDAMFSFSPMTFGIRGGCRFVLGYGSRFALVPYVGYNWLRISGDDVFAKSRGISLGMRVDLLVLEGLGLSLTPEYTFYSNSKLMDNLTLVSPTIAKWNNGFVVRLGLHYVFEL